MVQRCDRRNAGSVTANSDTRASDHSKSRKDTPALPFCHLVLKARKPKDSRYPSTIKTLGDRLRTKRLDLGVDQSDVAARLWISEDTVCNWENNRVQPSRRLSSKINLFLEKA